MKSGFDIFSVEWKGKIEEIARNIIFYRRKKTMLISHSHSHTLINPIYIISYIGRKYKQRIMVKSNSINRKFDLRFIQIYFYFIDPSDGTSRGQCETLPTLVSSFLTIRTFFLSSFNVNFPG